MKHGAANSDLIIAVEGLGKKYRIRHQQARATLRDALTKAATSPFRRVAGRFGLRGAEEPRPGAASSASSEDFWALKDVSFEIGRGEVVGIIGRNGAGKSTLLKILSRITDPTEGRVTLNGRVASLLEVGTGFHPELSGRENVFLNGAILGMSRVEIRKKFDEIVAFAEVEKFLDTPVKHYSSGMYVRLAFAVAAHLEPEILIVDEVLAVGDAAFQRKCLGKMGDVAKTEGRTILFVSHNMAALTQLCGGGIWLEKGGVRAMGTAEEVVKSYMECATQLTAERLWAYPGNAPGDDRVRVLAGRVLQNGAAGAVVDINQECQIEIEFAVLQRARNLLTGINLYDVNGACILNSVDWRESELRPGRYLKRVTIPAQTLAEGRTSVLLRAVFYEPDVMSAVIPDALTFEAIDSDHPLAVRGHYKEAWPGAVRLRLGWCDAVPVAGGAANPA